MSVGRYIALAGDPNDLRNRASEIAHLVGMISMEIDNWGILLHDSGLVASRLPCGDGALVGHLFDRDDDDANLFELPLSGIADDRGRGFMERYWGPYLLLVAGRETRLAIRSPGGEVPAFVIQSGGATVITSSPRDCIAAKLFRNDINWVHVASLVRYVDAPVSATALEGLKELLPGCCLTLRPGEALSTPVWQPWRFACNAEIWRDRDQVAALRARSISTVRALARIYETPLARVSGGLDSSIVAASLAVAQSPMAMINMVAPGLGDEREYARFLAKKLDRPLFETAYDISLIAVSKPSAPHLPRPWGRYLGAAANAACREVSNARRVSIWQGHGGDSLFCPLGSALPLVDRIRAEGAGALRLADMIDIARANDATIWEVVRDLAKRLPRPIRPYIWHPLDDFLTADSLKQGELEPHCWLDPPAGALPGKLVHLANILASVRQVEGYQHVFDGSVVNPLLSQPMMELCLSIPSWLWCRSGRDRMLARQAFSRDLPDAISWRRTKGTPDPFCAEIVMAYRENMRSLLLDGLLVRHGLLDGLAIDKALATTNAIPSKKFSRLLQLADAEAWAQSWVAC